MHRWHINWLIPRHDLQPSVRLRLTASRRWRIPIYQCCRRSHQRQRIWLPHHLPISKRVITSYHRPRIPLLLWWDRIRVIQHPLQINWLRRNYQLARSRLLSSSSNNSHSRSSNKRNSPVKGLPHRRGISRLLPVVVELIYRAHQQVYNNLTLTALTLIKLSLALILRKVFNNLLDRRHNPSGIKTCSHS